MLPVASIPPYSAHERCCDAHPAPRHSLEHVKLLHHNRGMTNYQPINDWRARINGREPHATPHVHIKFSDGTRVSLAIMDGSVLAGEVNLVRRLEEPRAWIELRKTELLAEYRRINP